MSFSIAGPFDRLLFLINAAVGHKQTDLYHDLQLALRKRKPDFLNLLKNPAKSTTDRQKVKNATREGIYVHGESHPRRLPPDFIEEALLLSDLIDTNEFAAVELVLTGEHLLPRHPGLTRGLVAVTVYHAERRNVALCLRSLVQARDGALWTFELSDEMTRLVKGFTDELQENGLVRKILDLLAAVDVRDELNKLERGRGVGGDKHRNLLIRLIDDQRLALAQCLYCWACQNPLSKDDVRALVAFLKGKSAEKMLGEDATLDPVYLSLFMTLLYCLNVEPLREMNADEEEEFYDRLTIFDYADELHGEIVGDWEWMELGDAVKLAWALVICVGKRQQALPDDEQFDEDNIFELAVIGGALSFFRKTVIGASRFFDEEFYVRKIHCLVTGLLVNMPLNIKQLRNENDEVARITAVCNQQGREIPEDLRHDFEELMKLIHDLYANSSLELEIEYWTPVDQAHSLFPFQRLSTSQRQRNLYKFMRLASDLLPAPLFAPYVNMLRGLASSPAASHHCYNFLKTNGISAGGAAASNAAIISWDHFFTSMKQYYLGMRQDAAVAIGGGGAPIHSLIPANISAQEIEGLQAVLQLLEQIVKEDPTCRTAMHSNEHWLPVPTLFGLLTCPVPLQLKASLLRCLAAFARTPEIAMNMWTMLESHQVLQTVVPAGGVAQQSGIKTELEEIESRNEEYPETRAFLAFLDSLTETPIPPGLGAGYRPAGFDPYLSFLRDTVFLKFNTRAYHNGEEKWMVCADVLTVLHKLLQHYEPETSHFADEASAWAHSHVGDRLEHADKPPGYTIMLHLLNESQMFQKIMHVIDVGAQYVVSPVKMSKDGRKALEQSVLLALQMLEIVLNKEAIFFDFLRDNNSLELATSLEHLLFSVNASTNQPDLYINIARFVCEHDLSLELVLTSIRILCAVSRSGPIQRNLVGVLTSSPEASREILHGFMTHLESSEREAEEEEDIFTDADGNQVPNDNDVTEVQLVSSIRQHIVHLLLISLQHQSPTVAHFLLGFELMKPPSQTNLQDPGVHGSPRTCLHAILDILNEHLSISRTSSGAAMPWKPHLVQLAYQLVYALASNSDTSQPTVRYLRSSYDFFCRHLERIPFPRTATSRLGDDEDENVVVDLIARRRVIHQAWFLKCLALELRLTALNKQHSHAQRIVGLLLSESLTSESSDGDVAAGSGAFVFGTGAGDSGRKRLLRLLDDVDLTQECSPELSLQIFDVNVVVQLIGALEGADSSSSSSSSSSPLVGASVATCDLKRLNVTLMNELNSSQGIPATKRREVIQEIRHVLDVALERNRQKERMIATKQFLVGWQQLTEVLLTALPVDLLNGERRRAFVFELMQEILLKVSGEDVSPHLSGPLYGVILVLMAQLRPEAKALTSGHVSGSSLPAGTLHSILRKMLENVMTSNTGQLRVRSCLYAALLYYLQSTNNGQQEAADLSVVFGVSGGVESQDNLQAGNLAILSGYGEALMERICRDACDGTGIIQMLAFSVLDSIIAFDWQNKWLNHLLLKGYLQHSIDSLVHDDTALQAALAPNPEPLKALYIYESKMAFLTRLAQSSAGAQALFRCSLISRLSDCSFLAMRPETTSLVGVTAGEAADEGYSGLFQDSFLPAVTERYRQLLLPALKLVLTMQNSLGKQHQEASFQVLCFISNFSEVFYAVLKGSHRLSLVSSLEEVALVTGIVYRVAVGLGQAAADSPNLLTCASRLRRLMLSLLYQYCLPDSWENMVKAVSLSEGGNVRDAVMRYLQEICSNLMSYCRHAVSGGNYGSKFRMTTVVFEPLLSDDSHSSATSFRLPTLNLLLRHLHACCDNCLAASDEYQLYRRKLANMSELSSEEMREHASAVVSVEKLTVQQREELAKVRLEELIESQKQDVQNYHYIIENSLYVLWSHMEFFFVYCKPKTVDEDLSIGFSQDLHSMRRLQDPGFGYGEDQRSKETLQSQSGTGITRAALKTFKTEAAASFSESFFKKLIDVEATQGEKRLIQALSRRLKRLLKLQS